MGTQPTARWSLRTSTKCPIGNFALFLGFFTKVIPHFEVKPLKVNFFRGGFFFKQKMPGMWDGLGGLLTTMTFETFWLEISEIEGECFNFSDNGVITPELRFPFRSFLGVPSQLPHNWWVQKPPTFRPWRNLRWSSGMPWFVSNIPGRLVR